MTTNPTRRAGFAIAFGVDCMIPYVILVAGPYTNPLHYVVLTAIFAFGVTLGWHALGRSANRRTTIDLRDSSIGHEIESTVDLRVSV